MAHYAGYGGAVYKAAYIKTDTIAFHENDTLDDTITDSNSGFIDAQFAAEDEITVDGSTSNDGDYTIDTVVAGTITLDTGDDLVEESAGGMVTIIKKAPGTVTSGFYGWELNDGREIADVTDFNSANGWREFMPTLRRWTATLDRYWDASNNEQSILGVPQVFRFFTKYEAEPGADVPAIYYEGIGIINEMPVSVPVGEIVTQRISVTGLGAIVQKTQTTDW